MSLSKNFENIPRSLWGATGPKCKFFSLNLQRGPCPGARGDRGLSPPPPHAGDRVLPPYINILPPFPPHLSPKIPPKIQKKREGEEKGSGEVLPDCALVICRLVHLAYVFFHWYCRVI